MLCSDCSLPICSAGCFRMSNKARGFCFTLNNYTVQDHIAIKEYFESENARYWIMGEEIAPTTNTPHLQGYVLFHNPRHFNVIKNKFRWHVEKAVGTPWQNKLYCQKGEHFEEAGDIPTDPKAKAKSDGAKGGAIEKKKWDAALAACTTGHFDGVDPRIRITQARNLEFLSQKLRSMGNYEDAPNKVLWLHGATGAGKSRAARATFTQEGAHPDLVFFKSADTIWWDGYQGEPYVVIDDIDIDHSKMGYNYKIWFDRYPFMAQVKGGTIKIRPQRIIVTSNYTPENIWQYVPKTLEPILRRCEVISFDQDTLPFLEPYRLEAKEQEWIASRQVPAADAPQDEEEELPNLMVPPTPPPSNDGVEMVPCTPGMSLAEYLAAEEAAERELEEGLERRTAVRRPSKKKKRKVVVDSADEESEVGDDEFSSSEPSQFIDVENEPDGSVGDYDFDDGFIVKDSDEED